MSNAGCKRINLLILIKMLDQQFFNFNDDEVEFQVNDRRLFKLLVNLGVMNVIDKFFEMFEGFQKISD